ncbi:MAG: chemotaxis protein CheX [Myxococcota bacterium]
MALVDQTWQTLFGDGVVETPTATPIEWDLCSEVRIQGAWNGSVSLAFPRETAERIAAGMLDAKPGELADEEVRDAVGEMANILAGNLKAMLPQPSSLGLPAIHDRRPGSNPESRRNEPSPLCCAWGECRFSVMIDGSAGADGD